MTLKLAAAVKPDLYGSLVYVAEQTAKWETDPKLKAYWSVVHKALGG